MTPDPLLAALERIAEEIARLREQLDSPHPPRQQVLPFPATFDPAEQLVTLDQIAAIVNLKKRSLERYRDEMPGPAIPARRGRRSHWRWRDVRPWLEATFHRRLPEQFPWLAG